MSEFSTLARPYAEAVFKHALESGKLDHWAEILEFLALAVQDPELAKVVANPKVEKSKLLSLMAEIGKGVLDQEGLNFVRLLIDNDRINLIGEIRRLYHQLQAMHEGVLDVEVTTAFDLSKDNEQALMAALQKKFGKEIRLHIQQERDLIGGVVIKAGDKVIDGSVRGQLECLSKRLFS